MTITLQVRVGELQPFNFEGKTTPRSRRHWKTNRSRHESACARPDRLDLASARPSSTSGSWMIFQSIPMTISGTIQAGSFATQRSMSFRPSKRSFERCILMATDPGDFVLDPTCGSGTTAYVAEQWGRRWITIDTSRVALALARAVSWVLAIHTTCLPTRAKDK